MGSAAAFQHRSGDLAQRFLQTAVVVDDRAYMALDGAMNQRRRLWRRVRERRHQVRKSESRSVVG